MLLCGAIHGSPLPIRVALFPGQGWNN